MIARADVDTLLTPKFFKTPIRRDLQELKCNFRLPPTPESMKRFFAMDTGRLYLEGVYRLISRLNNAAIEQHIDLSKLAVFYSNIQSIFIHDMKAFLLLTDGMKMLLGIVTVLESSSASTRLKELMIREFEGDIDACSDGCYTLIKNAYLKSKYSPALSLLQIRMEMGQYIAQQLISKYNTKLEKQGDSFNMILRGDITHYNSGILNYHAIQFGLEKNPDKRAKSADQVSHFSSDFMNEMTKSMSAENIINYVIKKLELDEFIEHVKNNPHSVTEYNDNFIHAMNSYGEDPAFNLNYLFDQDAIVQGNIVKSVRANEYLFLSIIYRLSKSGYLNLLICSQNILLENNANLIYFPNYPLSFSHVLMPDRSYIPLDIYCIEQLKLENLSFLYLLTEAQRIKVTSSICSIISLNPISILIPDSAFDENEYIHYYSLVCADPRNEFRAGIIKLMNEDNRKYFINYIHSQYIQNKLDTSENFSKTVDFYLSTLAPKLSEIKIFPALCDMISSYIDFREIITLVDDHLRHEFFLLLRVNQLKAINKGIPLPELLKLFNHEDRYDIVANINHYFNLYSLINSTELLADLFASTSVSDYELLAIMFGIDKLKSFLPDYNALRFFINNLPETGGLPFLAVLAKYLKKDEMDHYHGGDDRLYNRILQQTPRTYFGYISSFFAAPVRQELAVSNNKRACIQA